MKISHGTKLRATAMVAAAALTLGLSPRARAQDTIQTETGPNRALLRSGIVLFGASYVPAFIVASTNPRSDDDYLYLPVVGPWFDLAKREPCVNCDKETLNKALLVTDGIFQGIGALEFVGSFMFMETTIRRTVRAEPRRVASAHIPLTITPGSISTGYGILASGEF